MRKPYEVRALSIEFEPWTVEDVVSIGRLAGTDVTWLKWFSLLPYRDSEAWPSILATAKQSLKGQVSFSANGEVPLGTSGKRAAIGEDMSDFAKLLRMVSKSGSNSYVLAPEKTANGSAMIANDPHLGLLLPNLWLLAGVKSPSYHTVGMMAPGLPIFALGRNPDIAWGGTNLHGANSDLIDVSDLPKSSFSSWEETLKVRLWTDERVTVRMSSFGPVLSDGPMFEGVEGDFAVKWIGHEPSDEIGSMLSVAKAKSWEEFRASFSTFALPAQNMLYADAEGNIGQLIATQLPNRDPNKDYDLIRKPKDVARDWQRIVTAEALPNVYNPAAGFLASSNNRPTDSSDVLLGYFFGAPDRVERLQSVLSQASDVTVDDLSLLQRDVYMMSSVRLRDTLFARLETSGFKSKSGAYEEIAKWDGHYDAESRGALAFESFFAPFVQGAFTLSGRREEFKAVESSGAIKSITLELMDDMDDALIKDLAIAALINADKVLKKHKTWGDLHRLELAHPFANFPLAGNEFTKINVPVGGSSETLMKTAHGLTTDVHTAFYGSQSRHISDMSDLDENYFVLTGGQDGWINSSTFADQIDLWREGKYIRLPLRLETVEKEFPRRMVLSGG